MCGEVGRQGKYVICVEGGGGLQQWVGKGAVSLLSASMTPVSHPESV